MKRLAKTATAAALMALSTATIAQADVRPAATSLMATPAATAATSVAVQDDDRVGGFPASALIYIVGAIALIFILTQALDDDDLTDVSPV